MQTQVKVVNMKKQLAKSLP